MSNQELVKEEQPSTVAAESEAEAAVEEVVGAEADASITSESSATPDAETDSAESKDPASAEADPSVSTIFNLEPRQHIRGKVKNITRFGAFVDLGLPQDGLVHISELSRKKVDKVEDVVQVGQEVDVWVKKVDRKRGRISLTMIKPVLRRIRDISEGDDLEGSVTRLEPYGAFVDIDSERDGLVHISQITHDYIKAPEEALEIGQRVDVKVLKVNRKKRQVDLSIKALLPPPFVEEEPVKEVTAEAVGRDEKAKDGSRDPEEQEPVPTAMAVAFASLQEKDETEEDFAEKQTTKHDKDKHKEERDEIIARTLATKQ